MRFDLLRNSSSTLPFYCLLRRDSEGGDETVINLQSIPKNRQSRVNLDHKNPSLKLRKWFC